MKRLLIVLFVIGWSTLARAGQITGPANVDFGMVDVGSSSPGVTFSITNTGASNLSITSATVSQAPLVYAVLTGTPGAQLVVPGGMASWTLTCTPIFQGSNLGQFRILSDSTTNATLNISLTCGGQRGVLAANPPSVDFGGVPQGTQTTRSVTLTNPGNLAVTGISAVIMQTAGQGYTFDAATVPMTLGAGASASITVKFLPPDGNGGGNATLVVSGMWSGVTMHAIMVTVSLAGDGLSEGVDISPAAGLDYGMFRWDAPKTLAFCVVNSSQFSVAINDITVMNMAGTLVGEFAVTGLKRQSTCHVGGAAMAVPGTLASNEILEVSVTATPMNRIGVLGATVTVTTGLVTNPTRTIALMGTAVSGMVTVAPGMELDLGTVDVDAGPVMHSITITNTGVADFDLASCAVTTPSLAIMIDLPANQTLAPSALATIDVTYDPSTVATDSTTVICALAHILNGPTMAAFAIHGRGIDRRFSASETQVVFPDTFKNPGTSAPVHSITIANTGEATLHVASATFDGAGAPAFALVDPDDAGPIDIAGGTSHDYRVRFFPTTGMTSMASLALMSDDDLATGTMATISLLGTGLNRDVSIGPRIFDVGIAAVGGVLEASVPIEVVSMDTTHAFTIRTIASGDPQFQIHDARDIALAPSTSEQFTVTFTPVEEGVIETTAHLFLDMDPDAHAAVTLRGTAVSVDVHGGGGCDASGGSGSLILAPLIVLPLRRRRRS